LNQPRPRAAASRLAGGSRSRSGTALLLIDVINGLDFPGAAQLRRHGLAMSVRLSKLAARARESEVPVVYVNDNFGRWESDWRKVVAACLSPGSPGRAVSERLRPHEGDFFVLKPAHSGFHGTPLDELLRHLGARRLILTGIATDFCVLFTANDAYMRGYELSAPSDCCAAETRARHERALALLRDVLQVDVTRSTRLALPRPRRTSRARSRRRVRAA
jgi:nicotinamidase-related amidase